jgi:hypothetical protein
MHFPKLKPKILNLLVSRASLGERHWQSRGLISQDISPFLANSRDRFALLRSLHVRTVDLPACATMRLPRINLRTMARRKWFAVENRNAGSPIRLKADGRPFSSRLGDARRYLCGCDLALPDIRTGWLMC